jgi:hypothetical protein
VFVATGCSTKEFTGQARAATPISKDEQKDGWRWLFALAEGAGIIGDGDSYSFELNRAA